MTKNKALKKILYLAIAAVVVLLDRWSKVQVVASFGFEKEGDSVSVIPGFLDFTYFLNDGATAGMLSDNRWVFMTVSSVAIVALLGYMIFAKKLGVLYGISLSMIVGGGVGNMIDRVAFGKVVDFFDVTCVNFFPFTWSFNVADIFVCVGCGLLILAVIVEEVKDRKKKAETAEKHE